MPVKRPANDRGGVAVIVALLLGAGVLLGMAALAVDVGLLHAERAQLQSGADAAATRVAQVCAQRPADCTPWVAAGTADQYADANADDGAAAARVCGRGGTLDPCGPPLGNLTDCVLPAPSSGNYVQVHADTELPDGTTLLPPVFAQALVTGYEGTQVSACSRVAWGAPLRAHALPMALSLCDWTGNTAGGTFPDPPVEVAVPLHADGAAATCGPGGPAPGEGGFRWLAAGDPADCRATVSAGTGYPVRPDAIGTAACRDALLALRDTGRAALVPVFGAAGATYATHGLAAFVVTGWRLPASDLPSTLTGRSACDGGATACVYGYFDRVLLPGAGAVGGPDLGARAVVGAG